MKNIQNILTESTFVFDDTVECVSESSDTIKDFGPTSLKDSNTSGNTSQSIKKSMERLR